MALRIVVVFMCLLGMPQAAQVTIGDEGEVETVKEPKEMVRRAKKHKTEATQVTIGDEGEIETLDEPKIETLNEPKEIVRRAKKHKVEAPFKLAETAVANAKDEIASTKNKIAGSDGKIKAMLMKHKGMKFALKGGKDGKYCCDGPFGHVKCDRHKVGTREKFTFVSAGKGLVALKGGHSGKYCKPHEGKLVCNAHEVNNWAKFAVKDAGAGKIALINMFKYCADEGGKVECNREHIGSWEKFTAECVEGCTVTHLKPGSKIILKGGNHGKYCADTMDGTVKCDRHKVGKWEKFTVVDAGGGNIALKGGRGGKYCAAHGTKGIDCNRDKIGPFANFAVKSLFGRIALINMFHYCGDEHDKIKCNRKKIGNAEKFTAECVEGCQAGKMFSGLHHTRLGNFATDKDSEDLLEDSADKDGEQTNSTEDPSSLIASSDQWGALR